MAETVSALLHRGPITREALARAQGLEGLVGCKGDMSRRRKNLPDDSSIAAWPMHDVDMIRTAPVQRQDTESTKMDVHWKRGFSLSLLGTQIDQERKGLCDSVMRRPSFLIFPDPHFDDLTD
ncbi:hypothetical protein ACJ73_05780 [Blastomyces percursus]|uniref:Uncharacterized protein n=1 Tax=Blastomyces percursus TaxID=1658174 RepID=A0A1J9R4E5_9EURO|nr:hypothetical protein ACJ73_05780 [Blastomyces percursus]